MEACNIMGQEAAQLDALCTSLAADICTKVNGTPSQPFFVFIGGGRATGKSTIAAALQKMLPASIVVSEDYYIFSQARLDRLHIHVEDPVARDKILLHTHIQQLKKGVVIRLPVEGPLASVPGQMFIDPQRFSIIIIEGTGVFDKEYDAVRDYSIFIECSDDMAETRFIDRCLLNPERNPFATDHAFPKKLNADALSTYFRTYVLPYYHTHFIEGARKADQILQNNRSSYEKLIEIAFPNGRTFYMKPPTQEDMTVRKGAVSKQSYDGAFFGNIFQHQKALTPHTFASRYHTYLGPVDNQSESGIMQHILNTLFDAPDATTFLKKSSETMPFLWKSQPDIRRGFKWADSAIKLIVEQLSPHNSAENFQITAELISDTIKLTSKKYGLYVFNTMDVPSFMRLLNNAATIVCGAPITHTIHNDSALMVRNQANLETCRRLGLTDPITVNDRGKLTLLLKLAAYAGITFPSEESIKSSDSDKAEKDITRTLRHAIKEKLAIDQTNRLIDILMRSKEVSIILDDNGECVPDLLFIQNIVRTNSICRFNFLLNKNQIGVNLRADMLRIILEYPEFLDLKQAFADKQCVIIEENSASESLSYELLSESGRSAIDRSKLTYVKGQLFFETFSNKSAYTAYVFVPSSSTAVAYSGYVRGGVVAVYDKYQTRIVVNDRGEVTKSLSSSS